MVTLIGMGSGKWEALSAQAQQAVRSAGLVFGAKRMLAGLPADCTARQFALYQPADILETLAQNSGQDAAVLYSGDTGFYSGASGLLTPLRALGIPARVYPGVSSIQLLSAALGRPWQDWKLVSAHGCACDPVAECMMNRSVFFLTGGTETPASLCQKLTDAGMGEAHGVVGENLGTEAEAIRYGKSNLSDAVRWVLGETSSRQLRAAGKMEDVIFGGTRRRSAMGFASVRLTLDNTGHTLDVDADEVTIGRKYYRSGDSEYTINGQVCRLRAAELQM